LKIGRRWLDWGELWFGCGTSFAAGVGEGFHSSAVGDVAMVHRLIGVTGLVLLWAGFASAQTPAKSAEQLTKDVLELQQKVANTAENVRLLAEQVVKNTEADTTSSKEIERLAGVISDELKKQEAILAKLDVLMQQQQEQLARQQAILDAIVHKDTAGRDVLQLSATMEQSEEFREDVRKAVHQALQTHGELTIWNRMSTRQQVVVNQKPYEIDPDEILMVTAPVGTVSAQLPGQGLTNWTLSAPTYRQKIEIVPQSDAIPTEVARPITEPQAEAMVPLPSRVLRMPEETSYLLPPGPVDPPIYIWPIF
jgi:hypothetical protein